MADQEQSHVVGQDGWGKDLTSQAALVKYREKLRAAGHIVDPESWAGGLEDKRAIAPRLRVGRDKWFNLLWLIPI
ncbi:MAG TPA: hypothetical protein VFR27_12000, partial [Mycobacterium sp.]|nr:hypothetical protein [Mycobacterium sp.]